MAEEGPNTAAYDFEQARIDVSATHRAIRAQERSLRHTRATLIAILCTGVIVLVVLNLTRLPGAPIRLDPRVLVTIDIVVVLAAAALLYRVTLDRTEE